MDDGKGGHMSQRKALWTGVALGVAGLTAITAAVGLTTVYSGAFNVAATEQHSAFARWALDTTYHNSIQTRARSVRAPEQITPQMLEAGATAYKSMCQHCHAGPGVERDKWASGMRPRPPHLVEAAADWEQNEIFWIAKQGVKMSGMPAFGPTHDDQTLWGVAAFVKQLPGMDAARYSAMGAAQSGSSGDRHGH